MCVRKANRIPAAHFSQSFQPISVDSKGLQHHLGGGGRVQKKNICSFLSAKSTLTLVLTRPLRRLATTQRGQKALLPDKGRSELLSRGGALG